MGEGIADTISRFLGKIFGTQNERIIKRLRAVVPDINALEPRMQALSDEALRTLGGEFRKRLADGADIDGLLPEVFAATREASRRNTANKMRHFDVQLVGGLVLHQGKIAEMATGEGKTLVATLPAALNALTGRGVHIVTVNDYLARRDCQWMGPIFHALGITVGAIQHDQCLVFDPEYLPDPEERMHHLRPADKTEVYRADITYGTNNEFGFDYLRDNMKIRPEDQAQRGHAFAIVDEVDSILIDEARTPLIISGPAEESTVKYYEADRISKKLVRDTDYTVKEKEHQVLLTEAGIEKAQRLAGVDTFYSGDNMEWPHHIEQALRAHSLYRLDKEYVVKDGEVIIVDEFTGRLMPGRRWSDGLHQAVEAKEGLRIREENQTLATITLQNYFKLYKKLAGMTGTAATEAMEFEKIYKLDVVTIPTNMAMRRENFPDMIYKTHQEKWEAVEEEIVRIHATGRPVLVGTASIENSELVSERLKRRGLKHEVLNAKFHEREAAIVAKAGQPATVTIATNMAGRGTDILLGENVAGIGGLHILGTERHEARRIDLQLRGRAGRQGDPGSSQFFISLEDDLMRIFANEMVRKILDKLWTEEGVPLESPMVTRAIERAQKKMEEHNFDIRKNLLEYDAVMNEQRKIIYGQRQEILEGKNLRESAWKMIEEAILAKVDTFLPPKVSDDEWDRSGLAGWFNTKLGLPVADKELEGKSLEQVEAILVERAKEAYDAREKEKGPDYMRHLERIVLLDRMDTKWKDHLYFMDHLRGGIGLRGFAQEDPKLAYKREGYAMFEEMIDGIKEEVASLLFRVKLTEESEKALQRRWNPTEFRKQDVAGFSAAAAAAAAAKGDEAGAPEEKPVPFVAGPKTGRNEPCPCGSGKKFKKCCGRAAGGGGSGGTDQGGKDSDEEDAA